MSMPMKQGPHHWIPSIFNDFFNNEILVRNSATAPAINVLETDKEYNVEVAAAGMCKEDFKIDIDGDNDLTITMEKSCNSKDGCGCGCDTDNEKKAEENCECKGRYLRREFSYTKFQQTLVLPDDVDTAKIEAKVKHGVLRIHIPKKANVAAEKSIRTINIE